jgi:uncharacterized protein YndB with AHSA1/START domain
MMSKRSVQHDTIVVERSFDASPERVYAAWTDRGARRRWDLPGEGWKLHRFESDFRVGGREISSFGPEGGPVFTADGHFLNIVPGRRFLMAGTMSEGDQPISVSVTTIEIIPEGKGIHLILTEQAAFLDGRDQAKNRFAGWGKILANLDRELAKGT